MLFASYQPIQASTPTIAGIVCFFDISLRQVRHPNQGSSHSRQNWSVTRLFNRGGPWRAECSNVISFKTKYFVRCVEWTQDIAVDFFVQMSGCSLLVQMALFSFHPSSLSSSSSSWSSSSFSSLCSILFLSTMFDFFFIAVFILFCRYVFRVSISCEHEWNPVNCRIYSQTTTCPLLRDSNAHTRPNTEVFPFLYILLP